MRPDVLQTLQLWTFATGCAVAVMSWLCLWAKGTGCAHAFTNGLELGFGIAVAAGCLMLIYLCAQFAWNRTRSFWQTLIGS